MAKTYHDQDADLSLIQAKKVAIMRGPLALFALLPAPDKFTRAQLLSAQQTSSTSSNHLISRDDGEVHLWPYTSITDEHYRLYQQVS